MSRYFMRDTPQASFERLMMQSPLPSRIDDDPDESQPEQSMVRHRQPQGNKNTWLFAEATVCIDAKGGDTIAG